MVWTWEQWVPGVMMILNLDKIWGITLATWVTWSTKPDYTCCSCRLQCASFMLVRISDRIRMWKLVTEKSFIWVEEHSHVCVPIVSERDFSSPNLTAASDMYQQTKMPGIVTEMPHRYELFIARLFQDWFVQRRLPPHRPLNVQMFEQQSDHGADFDGQN